MNYREETRIIDEFDKYLTERKKSNTVPRKAAHHGFFLFIRSQTKHSSRYLMHHNNLKSFTLP
jgi:hypothetical protein